MFQNYIYVAIRNLMKNKLYSAINILGLAIGLAACILIALYVRDELSYDRFWQDSDRIHRMKVVFDLPGREPIVTDTSMGPLKQAIKQYFSEEIEYSTRFNVNFYTTIKFDDKVFSQQVMWTDPETVDIFDFTVVKGDLRQTLNDNASIALDTEVAERFFGDDDPIGKTVTITFFNVTRDFTVGAVYEKLPSNTVLRVPAMAKINEEELKRFSFLFASWTSVNNHTFIKLKEGADINSINNRMAQFTNDNAPFKGADLGAKGKTAADIVKLSTVPLVDIQLLPSNLGAFKPTGDVNNIIIFASIAVLVLLIACINFMNLATAKSTQRAREVALRKVLGASRKQLIIQFLGESILLALIGLVIGISFVELVMPTYNSFIGKSLFLNYSDPATVLSIVGLIFLVGGLAGIYPSLILSGFRPAATLKANKSSDTKGSLLFRNILVVIQFTISISLIICASVVYAQKLYATSMDPGYNKENLITIMGMQQKGVRNNRDAIKTEINKIPGIKISAYGSDSPSLSGESNTNVILPGANDGQSIILGYQTVDYDFFETFEITIVAGRAFSKDQALDMYPSAEGAEAGKVLQGNVIINESAVRRFGFASPNDALGKIIRHGSTRENPTDLTIIGVAADTHFQSLRKGVRPEIYFLDGARGVLTIRYAGNAQEMLSKVQAVWEEMMPDIPFYASFVAENVAAEFAQEQMIATMLAVFSGLAILVACLGLYGLAAFTAAKRTKEIGIRKVMGAGVMDVVQLLIWQFSKPVFIAALLAWPLSAWAMINWLQPFPLRLDSLWLIPFCLIAGLIAVMIAWITVGGNAAKVARANPIKALRYE